MNLIIAYIQPFMTDKVSDALRAAGVHGVTFLQCQGFGHHPEDNSAYYQKEAATLGLYTKTKIEIVCENAHTESIITLIREHAHTGHHGDGKIYISDISETVDIRTGERSRSVI